MMEGVIKSYVSEKRFGFIDGADGKSYFFHVDGFTPKLDAGTTLDGAVVQFDPTPTPKGLSAKRLTLAGRQATEWVLPSDFIVSRDALPRRGRVVAEVPAININGRDSPDDLRAEIRRIAADMGANALLSLTYSKSTGARGNYRFSIHSFSGRPAVVMDARATSNLAAAEASEKGCAEMGEALAAGHLAYLAELARKRRVIIVSVLCATAALIGLLILLAR